MTRLLPGTQTDSGDDHLDRLFLPSQQQHTLATRELPTIILRIIELLFGIEIPLLSIGCRSAAPALVS
ncbi:hypothetical protein ACQP1V_21235 [Microtetraspora malaysiensis]|uniref:hypothetical protein n=1 Tax=Microtetraspora malaysiensis TaxID=161358 RepID=UPI003D8AF915